MPATWIDAGDVGADEGRPCTIAEMAEIDFDLVAAIQACDQPRNHAGVERCARAVHQDEGRFGRVRGCMAHRFSSSAWL